MNWPQRTVYEAVACWSVKNFVQYGEFLPQETIKRIRVLAYEFFKDITAVELRQDYSPEGSANTYFSSYDIHPIFVTYMAAYEKAFHKRPILQQVKVTYHVITKFNCRKNDDVEYFYPVVGVTLQECDVDCLTWDYIEPWEVIDPLTNQPYKIERNENGCNEFVKRPSEQERFLAYTLKRSR